MFTSFLFEKLSHLKESYSTEKEFAQHLLSGQVTIPIPDLINYQQEYQEKRNKIADVMSPKDFSPKGVDLFWEFCDSCPNKRDCGWKGGCQAEKSKVPDDFVEKTSRVLDDENSNVEPIMLPSRYSFKHVVKLVFNPAHPLTGTIRGIHFYPSKVKYDIDVWVGFGGNDSTRIYNVDSVFVEDGWDNDKVKPSTSTETIIK